MMLPQPDDLGTNDRADTGSPLDSASRAEILKRLAREEGFELAGVCRPRSSEHIDFLRAWLGEGRHGSMRYLEREEAVRRRAELEETFPETRSVLVVGHEYHQPDPSGVPEDPSRGVVARYARGRDYHRVVAAGLRRVHRRFADAVGTEVPGRVYVDTGPILERELAERAGLGWFGRNTMLIHPKRGSYFFLGVLLLGVDLQPDRPLARDHCGTCHACLDACPTGALLGRDASGAPVMDARLCISYLTIENRGPIPRDLRFAIGNRVYGCDICQEVCPFNVRFAEESSEPGYAARGPGERPAGVEALDTCATSNRDATGSRPRHPGTDAPPLADLLETALDEGRWDAFSRGAAIRRAGRAGFARNVCVAIGNWLASVDEPPPEAMAVLREAARDEEPLIRGHAAWALGRIDSAGARRELASRTEMENDSWVRDEIAAASAR